ncbi:MAG: DUF2380 domain-containing protein, partial [Myxococcales bacterium]
MPRGMLAAQVVALAFALPATAQERAPSLAVLEFAVVDRSPVSDPAAIRAILASSGKLPAAWLAEALASIGSYRIVDSPRDACSGAACALEIGKAMPASRVAYGTIVKVSNLIWYANAALVDVAAGRVLRSEELE